VSKKDSISGAIVGTVVLVAVLGLCVFGVIALLDADFTAAQVLSAAAGVVCLVWMIVLLVVPWNVHFQARAVIRDIETSRDRGLDVRKGRAEEARRIAVQTRRVAIGGHVLTAALVAAVTFFSGAVIGYYFAAFYLVSTLFRPAHAWFAHLRERLGSMSREARHPRDDVLELKEKITFLEVRVENLRQTSEQLHAADVTLERRLEAVDVTTAKRGDELDRRLDAMGRRFEDTVASLTDNQEVIAGIKAFLRLLRTESA
jgi:hypothetical protein